MKARTLLEKKRISFEKLCARYVQTQKKNDTEKLYAMLEYFLGYRNESGKRLTKPHTGKRLRPSLCLLVASLYGVEHKVTDAALALELFHHFTLIHDDIEDNDVTRRGRPTVWKLWGINHGINAGDLQALLAYEVSTRAGSENPQITTLLIETFKEVIEGQYLDFEMSQVRSNFETRYRAMCEKKTAALFGCACELAGIAAKRGKKECAQLRTFGRSLGFLFQIQDDCVDKEKDKGRGLRTLATEYTAEHVAKMFEKERMQAIAATASLSLSESERVTLREIIDEIVT